ncbi:MAG: BMP family ABC transporter substrate-binding protein [Anaerolineales bacterium]|nr:BMP family ABC transporter substrate-binding protein [Anaerolineales bacterium]
MSILMIVIGLTACAPSPDCFREDVFCAALVTDTRGLNDHGLNQDTWTGLRQSQSEGVVDHIAYIESVDARDYEKNIAFFVNAGYDAIVTSGIGMQDAAMHSAHLEPDTVFIGINQTDDVSSPNFISVTFPEDQMGFFAGALAANLTRTGIVGAVCETSSIDAMRRYCEGFRAGAKHVDKSIKIIVVYRDNESSSRLFADAEWGTETAWAALHDGADVLFAVGGETGASALRAAYEAGALAVGAEGDQGAALGKQGSGVVTSVMGRAGFIVQELMRRIQIGNLQDAENSPVGYVPFDDKVSSALASEMDAILKGLADGEIKTNLDDESR